MKAVIFPKPGEFIIEDRSVPKAGDGQVLVEVSACGVCGTDIHIYHGEHFVEFPVIPGHEYSGVVVSAGAGVTHVKEGDSVTIDPNINCGVCHFCRRGEVHLCEQLRALGVNMDGGFARYSLVPASQTYVLPEGLNLDDAALTEPLACCVHGIDLAEIEPGDDVLVIGAGPVGLMMVQLARLAGAKQVIVSEPSKLRRELALELGADVAIDPAAVDISNSIQKLTRVGVDVAIECVGSPKTAEQSVSLVKRGGTVLLFGVSNMDAVMSIRPYDVFLREITIRGSFVNPNTHARAVELLASGRVKVEKLISHRIALEDFGQALDLFGKPGTAKILVKP